MPLINCEVNLILNQSTDCVISSRTGKTKFEMTDTKLYVPVKTWNKYQSKVSIQAPKAYLDYIIVSHFQGVKKHFV